MSQPNFLQSGVDLHAINLSYKNNNFPNLWFDLDCQLKEKDIYPIYKSNSGVCLSVVTNRAGQGRAARADTRPLDLLVARNNRLGGLLAVQTSNLHPNK